MISRGVHHFLILSVLSLLLCARAWGDENQSASTIFLGPANKHFDTRVSNSLPGPQKMSSGLDGLTAAGNYQFGQKYFALGSITSVRDNHQSQNGGNASLHDTEVSLGIGRLYKPQWLPNLNKSVELIYTRAENPVQPTNSPTPNMQTATVNKLTAEFDLSYNITDRLTSMLGFGVATGLLSSSAFHSNPILLGGLLEGQLTYQIGQRFFALLQFTVEYDAYSYSGYDPTGNPMTNTVRQVITSPNPGIGYIF